MLLEFLCPVTCNSKQDFSGTGQLLSVMVVLTVARAHTTSKTFLGKAQLNGTMNIYFGCGRNLSLISGCLIHDLGMYLRLHIVLTEFLQTKHTEILNTATSLVWLDANTGLKDFCQGIYIKSHWNWIISSSGSTWPSLQQSFPSMFRLFMHADNWKLPKNNPLKVLLEK